MKIPSTATLSAAGALVALGIVFGDIGTSPLYVMSAILKGAKTIDRELVLGALSCIIWTLTIQTTVKYVIITLRADNKGEGGIFAIFTLVRKKYPKSYIFAIIGSCALLADGIITPSITVTSAVEGLSILSPHIRTVPIVVIIISALFMMQRFGTMKIGNLFGPVMFLWFAMLGVLGIRALGSNLSVLEAFNPYYAANLLAKYPGGFILLGAVFLATTGAEALYSDLGHCGKKNIQAAWIYVKAMLIINYLGQGSWILDNLHTVSTVSNPFYAIMPHWFLPVGISVATLAAIIASQALISGSFTLISEGINLNLWPRLKLIYPTEVKGQIYIPTVNTFLWVACLFIVFHFQTSSAMQAAYGLAITVAMLMTTTMLIIYFHQKKVKLAAILLFLVVFYTVEGVFFAANVNKIFEGAWITILLMAIFAVIMYTYFNGLKIKNKFVKMVRIEDSIPMFIELKKDSSIPKTASELVYITSSRDSAMIESKILYSIFNKQPKRAECYWFLHVETLDDPYILDYHVDEIQKGMIYHVTIRMGFKTSSHVYDYFKQIVSSMQSAGKISLLSPYPSLAKYGIKADFLFVLIERTIYNYDNFPLNQQTILKLHKLVKRIGDSTTQAYQIDEGVVRLEKVPLIRGKSPQYQNLKEI